MRKKELNIIQLLKSPISGGDVEFCDDNYLVERAKSRNKFKISAGIPIMISDNSLKVDKHVEHYHMDAKYFDYFREKPKSWRGENERLHQNLIKLAYLKKANNIVDVGSGGGWLVDYIINKTKSSIIPFDISFENIKKLQSFYPSERNIGLVGDAMNFPFKDNCLERILAIEIIEHVPDPKKFIFNLLQALKSDGSLIISTPYNEKIESSLCIHCNKPTPHNAHLHSFDERKLLMLLPDDSYHVYFRKCNNTLLVKLRLHILFRFLPLKLWNVIDQLFIKMTGKAERIIMKISKKSL